MKNIAPAAVWDVRPWGSPAFRIDDFNDDGQNEVLFLQTAGAHANEAFDPRCPQQFGYKTGAEDQDLFCMTLTDCRGEILWQLGEPWGLDRPFSWNGHWNEFCQVVDLDGDGRTELLFIHRGELRIYDGATGELRDTKKMPNTAFTYIRAVKTDQSGRRHLFAKSGSSSPTHSYGNPSILMDHNLDIVWEQEVAGAGHQGNFADVDGDGLDELLIGFSLFDHDGTLLWANEPFSKGDHLDDSEIADLDDDGHFEFAFAHDGHDATVHNDDGTERFRVAMHHCQEVTAGKFFAAEPGQQLLFVDRAGGPAEGRDAAIVGAAGRELSRHRSTGYSSVVNWPTDVGPQSLIRLERPYPLDGDHRVVWVEPTGRELAIFEARRSFADLIARNDFDTRADRTVYHGAMLSPSIGDIDGDGRDELLLTDRDTVWLFKNE